MARQAVLRVDFKGPFFTKDPAKTFQKNRRDLMAKVADEGERDVRLQMLAGQGSRDPLGGGIRPNRVSAHVAGRTRSRTGKQWQATAYVTVNTKGLNKKQTVRLMAAASRLESSIHPFRRTTSRIRRARAFITADLTKGLD